MAVQLVRIDPAVEEALANDAEHTPNVYSRAFAAGRSQTSCAETCRRLWGDLPRRSMVHKEDIVIRSLIGPALIVLVALAPTRPLAGQNWSVLGGALAGVGAGAWVGLGHVTVRARSGVFVESTGQGAKQLAIPALAGLGTGIALGVFGEDHLDDTVLWGAVGWASGLAVGALIGSQIWDDPPGPWAGAVIGGAAGLLVGGIAGFVNSGEGDGGVPAMIRISL